ncbi:DoxX family membrane protein [Olivibacter sp. SDN3]|uniref:BT_3928 family protein n=1 Tax=Olivibacter sp. SDN3 TaxID=2764720 RepID=UPI001651144F|nr:BT_3928 family protein [Olivibacter sp. SDN3]QNL50048.1 DoxX family membrane protein [Olivibacter sp. SDN3]
MQAISYKYSPKRNYLLVFSRIFVGCLFIFSGLIKANDPIGFGYKLQEYFEVFHLIAFQNQAVMWAILLCSLEMVLGILLLLGLYGKKVALGLLILILFFTFLTFYSAFFNVVTSCGCFGDAIPLTPWQSFSKDLILLVFIGIIFYFREQIIPLFHHEISQALTLSATIVFSLGIGVYTYNFLPFIDFLPYKEGNNLPELMRIPEGAPMDEYEISYTLKHKESGEIKKVTDKIYLAQEFWKDENWEIIGDPESKLVKVGYDAPIKDLNITDARGVEYTKEIIENPYYNLLIVSYNLDRANQNALEQINEIAINAAEQYNIRTVLLTSSAAQKVDELNDHINLFMETFYADAVPLKSMVRANPGIILMKNGYVIKKWHYHTLPTYEALADNYFSNLD